MTRFLRTILVAHKIHLRHPKCIIPPLLSNYSATADSSKADDTQKATNETTTATGWSKYGHIYGSPVVQHSNKGDENPSSGRAKDVSMEKKKGKMKTQWVCSDCGHTTGQWWGTCPECEVTGTMEEFHESKLADKPRSGLAIAEDAMGSWLPKRPHELRPMKLEEVNRGFNHDKWRIPLSGSLGNEVSTVLGGGLVPGSLTLVGGDPGIGKTTLLLQISAMVANECSDGEAPPVVYVSGEESLKQICSRADRLGIKSNIYLYSSTDIEDILRKTHGLSPRALVVDSIQTVYLNTVIGSAGGVMQVKECTAALMRFAKTTNISVFLIGHVTKSGEIAGPRVLEHIVDVVLYMEGEKYSPYRMLRAVKNRFGSTDELAVLEMSQSGLQVVSNASEMFLTQQHSDSNVLAGLATAVIMDGTRTFLVEIQVLIKQAGLNLQDHGCHETKTILMKSMWENDVMNYSTFSNYVPTEQISPHPPAVFLNIVSGLTMTETSGDLAIAAAICSSFLEFPIPEGTAFIGEIGLGGELRMVPRIDKRVNTLEKLGYKMCVVPKQAEKLIEMDRLEKMKVVGCKDLKEMQSLWLKYRKRSVAMILDKS
ncbi:unnamed protein product [Sphenostylis stenocarpa]|uniref:RecA family profile 1 domain-containing protein n=1 Tax=Sphenostylis stenocarpa TaxID=92480 RepID=A0AA86SKY0_9FABA|nr:unnamed protein product [Sphenostylis stenocarpa]